MEQAQAVVEGIKECVTTFITNNDELKGVTTIPVVFCGDFNAQPDTPAYKWMHDKKSVTGGSLDSFGIH
jgi:endonuclease/exonuclease/phosphatase family metal-dependent hydrolase